MLEWRVIEADLAWPLRIYVTKQWVVRGITAGVRNSVRYHRAGSQRAEDTRHSWLVQPSRCV